MMKALSGRSGGGGFGRKPIFRSLQHFGVPRVAFCLEAVVAACSGGSPGARRSAGRGKGPRGCALRRLQPIGGAVGGWRRLHRAAGVLQDAGWCARLGERGGLLGEMLEAVPILLAACIGRRVGRAGCAMRARERVVGARQSHAVLLLGPLAQALPFELLERCAQ